MTYGSVIYDLLPFRCQSQELILFYMCDGICAVDDTVHVVLISNGASGSWWKDHSASGSRILQHHLFRMALLLLDLEWTHPVKYCALLSPDAR